MASSNSRLQYPILAHRRAIDVIFKNKSHKGSGRRSRLIVARNKFSSQSVMVSTKPKKYKDMQLPVEFEPMAFLD